MRIKSVAMFMIVMAVCLAALAPTPAPCQTAGDKADGGKIYLPLYRSVFIGRSERDYFLTVTVTIRNMNPSRPFTVLSLKLYDHDGKLSGELLKEAVVLEPMATRRWLVPKEDTKVKAAGGASLIIEWQAADGARPPLAHAMMVGTRSTLGLSYMTTGIPIK